MSNGLTLQQLRVLAAIAQTETLSGAATQLQYGLPTIVHHMKALEAACGAKLLCRSARGVKLTAAGKIMLREAQFVLNRLENAKEEAYAAANKLPATLKVATFPSIGSWLLPTALGKLQKQDNLQLQVRECEPLSALELLGKGEIDSALIYDWSGEPVQLSKELKAQDLIEEAYGILVPDDNKHKALESLDLSLIKDATWITSHNEDEASDLVLNRIYSSLSGRPEIFLKTDDITMITGFVRAGLSYALTTAAAVKHMSGLRLLPAVQDLGYRRVRHVWRADSKNKAVAVLNRIMLESFKS